MNNAECTSMFFSFMEIAIPPPPPIPLFKNQNVKCKYCIDEHFSSH